MMSTVYASPAGDRQGDLSIDDAYTMAGHLVRAASRKAPLLVATVINGITCRRSWRRTCCTQW
jgi:hypothetical protein